MHKPLRYKIGDATDPSDDRPSSYKFIAHCCNDLGGWGAGFVLALSEKFPEAEQSYRAQPNYRLGDVDFVSTSKSGIMVCNIIGQHGIGRDEDGGAPIRYDALVEGLTLVGETARSYHGTVHVPRLGAGLAGGDWNIIEAILESTCAKWVPTYVYDLAPEPGRKYENDTDNEVRYCALCSKGGHDTCGLTSWCACCIDTIKNMENQA